jgi:HEAT repeat protein
MLRALLSLVLCLAVAATASADYLELENGGFLRGELLTEARQLEASPYLAVRTLTGATISVAREQVVRVVRRKLVFEEYEMLRSTAADTADAQWQLAEWCRLKGLAKERAAQMQRVIELDKDHKLARRALGYTWQEGRWVTQEELMRERGYVKHKGRYLLPQELELILEDERATAAERAWFKKVRLWYGWLDSDRPDRQRDGLAQLKAIQDPDAVPAVVRTFRDERREAYRLLMIEILAQIESTGVVAPLVQLALREELQIVRDAAVAGLRRVPRGPQLALPALLRALRNEANVIVNRAAAALGQLGDDSAVPQLIEALITRHKYVVNVPENFAGFAPDGQPIQAIDPSMLPPDVAGLISTGQLPQGVRIEYGHGSQPRTRRVVVQRDHQNQSVLSSLMLLTGQNFGYDETAWRNWHRARQNGAAAPSRSRKS